MISGKKLIFTHLTKQINATAFVWFLLSFLFQNFHKLFISSICTMNFKLIPCLVWLCTSLSRLNCSIPPYHTNKQYVLINLILIFNHNIDYCSCCCCCCPLLCCLFFSCTAKERWPRALCFISRLSSIVFCFCTFITYELLWCYLLFF